MAWALLALILEIPSGAWADTYDRRRLLLLSAVIYSACFTTWMLLPTFVGFLLGFALWSASSALLSGTFEALIYDELEAHGQSAAFAKVHSRANAAAVLAMALASALAAPLYDWGGYQLVGWVSVGLTLVNLPVILMLPRDTRRERTPDQRRYRDVLLDGLREVRARPVVQRIVMASTTIVAVVAIDEFLPLLFAEQGASPPAVAWFVAGVILAETGGNLVASRWSSRGTPAYPWVIGAAIAGLVLATQLALPLSFALVALSIGAATAGLVAMEIMLQESIESGSRATVTSVGGLGQELGAMLMLAAVGIGAELSTVAMAIGIAVAAFGVLAVVAGLTLPRSGPYRDVPGAQGRLGA